MGKIRKDPQGLTGLTWEIRWDLTMNIFESIGFELEFHGIDMGLNAQC